ncbi:MAG: cytochrome c oxidase assembly protein [Actinomycetota bacterium]
MLVIPLVDPIALCAVVAGLVYAAADRRVRRARGHRAPRARGWAFFAGLAVLVLALTGPIDAAVASSFSMHMVQHLMLTMVAAPLLLLGAPLTLALAAWPKGSRRSFAAVLHSAPARIVSNPRVAWASFFVVLWTAHLTGLYESALRNDGVHALEHVAFLVTALVFWAPIVRADPSPSALSYPGKILYLFVAMPAMALLGLTIVSANQVLYPTYARAEGFARALADQRSAGAIMWAGTMVLIAPALGIVLWEWMAADEREARRVDARLARGVAIEPIEGSPG